MGVPVVTVTSNGQTLDPTVRVSVEIHCELNRIPEATLVVADGSVARREFQLSNRFFEPGKPVTIALRYEGDTRDTTVFDGLVVRHAVEARARQSVLRVELKDRAFKLTRHRKSAVFRDQSDADAISKVIGDAAKEPPKVKAGMIAPTKVKHAELIQYNASDWDFIVSRADVQGLAIVVDRGTISARPPALARTGKLTLGYGSNVHECSLEIDGGRQWSEFQAVGWDVRAQKPDASAPVADAPIAAGNLDAGKIARQLGSTHYTLLHPVVLAQNELQAWADARLRRSRFALLRGRVVIDGTVELAPLDTVEIAGIGDRFNGKALVSAVTHRVDRDGWKTELALGLSPGWFAREPEIADVPAGGLLPPISGLQIATVAHFENDPDGEHRIKVALPALDPRQGQVWARVARPDAGKDRGHVFWPEVGDEVVVGFLQDDPRQAIVLGSLYGSVNAPPAVVGGPSEANSKRALVSRAGSSIGFDDEQKTITIESPGTGKIVIDDHAKAITIADQHGNTIIMDSKGITLGSKSDVTIDASGKVVIKGKTVDVQ